MPQRKNGKNFILSKTNNSYHQVLLSISQYSLISYSVIFTQTYNFQWNHKFSICKNHDIMRTISVLHIILESIPFFHINGKNIIPRSKAKSCLFMRRWIANADELTKINECWQYFLLLLLRCSLPCLLAKAGKLQTKSNKACVHDGVSSTE